MSDARFKLPYDPETHGEIDHHVKLLLFRALSSYEWYEGRGREIEERLMPALRRAEHIKALMWAYELLDDKYSPEEKRYKLLQRVGELEKT